MNIQGIFFNTLSYSGHANGIAHPQMNSALPGSSALDRIIEYIKNARLPLSKKKMLVRFVWDMFKGMEAKGESSGSVDPNIEKKIYELIGVMELTENVTLNAGELARHAREIDRMVQSLRENEKKDLSGKEASDPLTSVTNAIEQVKERVETGEVLKKDTA